MDDEDEEEERATFFEDLDFVLGLDRTGFGGGGEGLFSGGVRMKVLLLLLLPFDSMLLVVVRRIARRLPKGILDFSPMGEGSLIGMKLSFIINWSYEMV